MSSRSSMIAMCACCILPCYIAVMIVFLVIPVLFIVAGILKLNDCPADSRIPIWMISIAGVILIERVLEAVKASQDRKFKCENPKPDSNRDGDEALEEWKQTKKENDSMCLIVLLYLIRTILFAGTILGSVFVFSIFKNRDQCDGLVFWSSFVYCVISLSIYVLVILLIGCLCCLLAMNNTAAS